ncbi:hypothetical protein N9544_07485 [Flavobacteriales bacterium]|jgi:hypothetical protein|nr:hypothetical protein [Flavobacteriales bacterium]
MDVEKFLKGTEFENLITKFHEEGIATLDDLRTLHRNGKMFELCKEITSTPIAAIKLKKLIQSQLNKAGIRLMVTGLLIVPIILSVIIYLVFF